jgi:HK97 family phage major capsid protein
VIQDAAFLANTTVNGPSGLLSAAGVNVIDKGGAFDNADMFHEAKATALGDNANVTVFLMAPDVALALAQAKEGTGSNKSLFENVGDGVTLAGVKVVVSPDVPAGNVWALDSSQVLVVQRTGTTVVKSADAAFDYDAVQVRATARVAFGFANPAGITRIYDAA